MRSRYGIAALLPCLALAGCQVANFPTTMGRDYERIDIITGDDIYSGRILSDRHDVELTKTGILLKPGARFAVKTLEVTQFAAQFHLAILEGTGVTAYMRTVPYRFDPSRGIALRCAVDGCSIRFPDGRTLTLEYNAETGGELLSLYNEAERIAVSVECDRLYEGESELPATEYVIFEPLPGSTVEIRSAAYFNSDTD